MKSHRVDMPHPAGHPRRARRARRVLTHQRTGTPVSNGLREREAEDLISKFMQSRKICCFEVTEVNPTLDKENLMAEIAFNILQRSVNVLMMN